MRIRGQQTPLTSTKGRGANIEGEGAFAAGGARDAGFGEDSIDVGFAGGWARLGSLRLWPATALAACAK